MFQGYIQVLLLIISKNCLSDLLQMILWILNELLQSLMQFIPDIFFVEISNMMLYLKMMQFFDVESVLNL
jgi:hypothetical protein